MIHQQKNGCFLDFVDFFYCDDKPKQSKYNFMEFYKNLYYISI